MSEFFEVLKASVELARGGEDERGARELGAAFDKAVASGDSAARTVGLHLAVGWEHLGEHEKAVAVLEKLLRFSPQDGRALYQLAQLRRTVGDLAGAEEAFQRSAELAREGGDLGLQSLLKDTREGTK